MMTDLWRDWLASERACAARCAQQGAVMAGTILHCTRTRRG